MIFDSKKAVWKMFLSGLAFSLSFFAQNIMPEILSPKLQTITVGALLFEIIDWIVHRINEKINA